MTISAELFFFQDSGSDYILLAVSTERRSPLLLRDKEEM